MISEFQRRWIDTLQSFKWLQTLADQTHDFAQITPFTYIVTVLTVAQGTSGADSTPIEDDSDFYLTHLTGEIFNATTGANITSAAFARVQVSDAATNRNLWREPVP